MRELGFKAQLVGHTETGIATVIRDFLPARMKGEAIAKFAKLWASREEVDAIDTDLTEHFCSPAELGWAHTINLDNHDFIGRAALAPREGCRRAGARARGPHVEQRRHGRALRGLIPAMGHQPPPPDLPCGQFRMFYLKVLRDDQHVGWASGVAYSPNIRRMISLARIRKDLDRARHRVVRDLGRLHRRAAADHPRQVHELPFIRQHRKDDLTRL